MIKSVFRLLAVFSFSGSLFAAQFVTSWDVGRILTCTVNDVTVNGYRVRMLTIADDRNVLLEVKDPARVVALFPTRDLNGLLVSVWQTGSAYRVKAFAHNDSKVECVLDQGTYYFPELFDVDGDGSAEILIRERSDSNALNEKRIGSKVTALKWDGKALKTLWTKHARSLLDAVSSAR
jgi:hypothetical protein